MNGAAAAALRLTNRQKGNSLFSFSQGSTVAGALFIWALIQQYCPAQLRSYVTDKYSKFIFSFFHPYVYIKFHELSGSRLRRSEPFSLIKNYLTTKASTQSVDHFKADHIGSSKIPTIVLTMDDHQEIVDEFQGIKVWWYCGKYTSKTSSLSYYPVSDERRYYQLGFHKKHQKIVSGPYLNHVMKQGREIKERNRQRRLYTNNGPRWYSIVLDHPANFETLAMEADKKKEIMDDLITFSKSGEFYAKSGRSWKRGYLLYGPPGTGKSTMIAAMANLLGYDLYDLELTAVKDNTELRRLLIEISSKSVIVIEDIDCSLDITKERKTMTANDEVKKTTVTATATNGSKVVAEDSSKVTLSGLLNFIDGLWSSSGGERLIVFTTNHVEKLDPALIRRGRMDKHIELSYCRFEAFKTLAKNNLHIESHPMFSKIEELLGETDMTPADVAEHLMPKGRAKDDVEGYLNSLIQALEKLKLEAEKKAKSKLEAEEKAKSKLDKDKEKSSLESKEKEGLLEAKKEEELKKVAKKEEKKVVDQGVSDDESDVDECKLPKKLDDNLKSLMQALIQAWKIKDEEKTKPVTT